MTLVRINLILGLISIAAASLLLATSVHAGVHAGTVGKGAGKVGQMARTPAEEGAEDPDDAEDAFVPVMHVAVCRSERYGPDHGVALSIDKLLSGGDKFRVNIVNNTIAGPLPRYEGNPFEVKGGADEKNPDKLTFKGEGIRVTVDWKTGKGRLSTNLKGEQGSKIKDRIGFNCARTREYR